MAGYARVSPLMAESGGFTENDVDIEKATFSDLPAIVRFLEIIVVSPSLPHVFLAEGLCASFADEAWWGMTEPLHRRPPAALRYLRQAARWRSLMTDHPSFMWIVARIKSTREIAGAAGWHMPEAQGFWNHNMWLTDVPDPVDSQKHKIFKSSYPWQTGEKAKLWDAIDVHTYLRFWDYREHNRKMIMKDEPHWYLAPFYVIDKYRERGIDSMLLNYAFHKADAHHPPTPIYVEAFPNAKAVLLRHGFVLHGVDDMVMTRKWSPKLDLQWQRTLTAASFAA